ncbi:glycosyltransferase, partial [Klebsiella pneumoniae]|nr:glycosyltransferase [Klebsiella pneumoniae]
NFGPVRSPYYGLLQANGEAVIGIVADFQDPPELIPVLLEKWEEGNKVVMGVKHRSKEFWLMFFIRKTFYRLLSRLSNVQQVED